MPLLHQRLFERYGPEAATSTMTFLIPSSQTKILAQRQDTLNQKTLSYLILLITNTGQSSINVPALNLLDQHDLEKVRYKKLYLIHNLADHNKYMFDHRAKYDLLLDHTIISFSY